MKSPEQTTLSDLDADSQQQVREALARDLKEWRRLAHTRRLRIRSGRTAFVAVLEDPWMQGVCRTNMRFRLDVLLHDRPLWRAWVDWVNAACRVPHPKFAPRLTASSVQEIVDNQMMNVPQFKFHELFTNLLNQNEEALPPQATQEA